ncbi:MAG: RNA polymerase sigma factor [Bacteroidales bacterium]|nr:RNA polymerase sigma factor [Clostridium sp.]MCM1204871.1 RNA polymerase sigma factor [Bacteroidales bacterium]
MEACDVELLVERYGNHVYRYCKSITYTPEDAEDLYQQTFLKAFELHKRISLEHNPRAYLMSIAANIWRNHKSRYARRERIAPTISGDEPGAIIEDVQAEDILEQLVKKEQITYLRECVDRLPDKHRQTVLLFYAGGLSVEEIARTLKIPKGTVKSRLHTAKEQLRKEMEGH